MEIYYLFAVPAFPAAVEFVVVPVSRVDVVGLMLPPGARTLQRHGAETAASYAKIQARSLQSCVAGVHQALAQKNASSAKDTFNPHRLSVTPSLHWWIGKDLYPAPASPACYSNDPK